MFYLNRVHHVLRPRPIGWRAPAGACLGRACLPARVALAALLPVTLALALARAPLTPPSLGNRDHAEGRCLRIRPRLREPLRRGAERAICEVVALRKVEDVHALASITVPQVVLDERRVCGIAEPPALHLPGSSDPVRASRERRRWRRARERRNFLLIEALRGGRKEH
jgi:hypothetical protein